MRFATTLALLLSVPLTGCSDGMSSPGIDQTTLCNVDGWTYADVAAVCKSGQKVVFLPQTFGNEQLPIMFAAINCDLRHEVALTTGGVTCIYNPITPVDPPAESAADSGEN
jgi:hypothetical protein